MNQFLTIYNDFMFKLIIKYTLIFAIIFLYNNYFFYANNYGTNEIIIDSDLSFEEAISGTIAPPDLINNLMIINVEYFSFDNKLHRGQLVINKIIEKDIVELFELIKQNKFPVKSVIPIVKYDWSDCISMLENNTSCFNYRTVSGTNKLSNHAFGIAIDINPMQNPYKFKNFVSPKGATYNIKKAGTISEKSEITKFLLHRNWNWGGYYKSIKDWQHFDKK